MNGVQPDDLSRRGYVPFSVWRCRWNWLEVGMV